MISRVGWSLIALAAIAVIVVGTARILAEAPSPDPAVQPPESAASRTSSPGTTTITNEVPESSTTSEPVDIGREIFDAATARATVNEQMVPGIEPSPTLGCFRGCPVVGFQDLSFQQGVTLENIIVTNPNGRCLDLTGSTDITIRNVTIIGCGTEQAVDDGYSVGMISITDAQNITIENSIIRDISNERFGASRNNAIEIRDSTNVTIRSNLIIDVYSDIEQNADDKGSRAIFATGSSSDITIDANRFDNAGRNAVQLSRLRDAVGISITNNLVEGRARWDSDYEDMINLFSSSGTPDDPIRLTGNTLRNGGPSRSGTGMILGDGNIDAGPTEYVVAEDNVLIDPGHVGINLAGGNNIVVARNLIVGVGEVPHATTVGMAINDFGYSAECRNHLVAGNRVWMDNQYVEDGINHLWNPRTCADSVELTDNLFGR